DRRRHFLGLAVADADGALTVADDHQGREAEPTSALDDLGHPVDGDEPLDVRALLRSRAAPTAVTPIAPVTALVAASGSALRSRHQMFPSVVLLIRTPVRPRGRSRRTPPPGRCRCCHPGRTRPW